MFYIKEIACRFKLDVLEIPRIMMEKNVSLQLDLNVWMNMSTSWIFRSIVFSAMLDSHIEKKKEVVSNLLQHALNKNQILMDLNVLGHKISNA